MKNKDELPERHDPGRGVEHGTLPSYSNIVEEGTMASADVFTAPLGEDLLESVESSLTILKVLSQIMENKTEDIERHEETRAAELGTPLDCSNTAEPTELTPTEGTAEGPPEVIIMNLSLEDVFFSELAGSLPSAAATASSDAPDLPDAAAPTIPATPERKLSRKQEEIESKKRRAAAKAASEAAKDRSVIEIAERLAKEAADKECLKLSDPAAYKAKYGKKEVLPPELRPDSDDPTQAALMRLALKGDQVETVKVIGTADPRFPGEYEGEDLDGGIGAATISSAKYSITAVQEIPHAEESNWSDDDGTEVDTTSTTPAEVLGLAKWAAGAAESVTVVDTSVKTIVGKHRAAQLSGKPEKPRRLADDSPEPPSAADRLLASVSHPAADCPTPIYNKSNPRYMLGTDAETGAVFKTLYVSEADELAIQDRGVTVQFKYNFAAEGRLKDIRKLTGVTFDGKLISSSRHKALSSVRVVVEHADLPQDVTVPASILDFADKTDGHLIFRARLIDIIKVYRDGLTAAAAALGVSKTSLRKGAAGSAQGFTVVAEGGRTRSAESYSSAAFGKKVASADALKQIESLAESLSAATAKVKTLEATNAELLGFQRDFVAARGQIVDYQQQLSDVTEKLAAANLSLTGKDAQISQHKAQLTEMASCNKSLSDKVRELEAAAADLRSRPQPQERVVLVPQVSDVDAKVQSALRRYHETVVLPALSRLDGALAYAQYRSAPQPAPAVVAQQRPAVDHLFTISAPPRVSGPQPQRDVQDPPNLVISPPAQPPSESPAKSKSALRREKKKLKAASIGQDSAVLSSDSGSSSEPDAQAPPTPSVFGRAVRGRGGARGGGSVRFSNQPNAHAGVRPPQPHSASRGGKTNQEKAAGPPAAGSCASDTDAAREARLAAVRSLRSRSQAQGAVNNGCVLARSSNQLNASKVKMKNTDKESEVGQAKEPKIERPSSGGGSASGSTTDAIISKPDTNLRVSDDQVYVRRVRGPAPDVPQSTNATSGMLRPVR